MPKSKRMNPKKTKEESNKKIATVAPEITDDTIVKHPLNELWTIWYLENDQNKTWEEMQNIVHSFDKVEDFWSVYDHILLPSELRQGNDYSMFKNNIRPMWEDAANKNGGRWVLNVSKTFRRHDRFGRIKLDDLWLDTLLCMMAEPFPFREHINGAVINIRHSGDRIAIWTKDCKNKDAVMTVGTKLSEYLRIEKDFSMFYESHGKNATRLYDI